MMIALFVLLASAAAVVYMVHAVGKFSFVKKLSMGRRWLRIILAVALLMLGMAVVSVIFSFINAIVFFLHVCLFFIIYELLFLVVPKQRRSGFKIYWQGVLALITSVIYIGTGVFLCYNIWQTDYTIDTAKNITPVRIALIADSHFGVTVDGERFAEYMKIIEDQNPDLLIIAGDFIDDGTSREDMIRACEALGELDLPYGVFYAYGNHDRGYYSGSIPEEELVEQMERNNVTILCDELYEVGDLCIVGREDAQNDDRAELSELLEGVDENRYIIVIDHEPNDYEAESATCADLVLSGHTHGGQLFPVTLMGKFFGNDQNWGLMNIDGTDFIVTSGLSDWELYFKTGTHSEYVIIDVC